MSEKWRDSKGRLLHNGEVQQKDGRYRFKYYDSTGKDRYIYSWRLDKNDKMPSGRKKGPSLRELEKKLQTDLFNHIVTNGGNMTVLELVEKYVATRTGVRTSTKAGYKTTINFLKKMILEERELIVSGYQMPSYG